jgi:hypothetical protein
MTHKFLALLAASSALGLTTLLAQEPAPNASGGTLTLSKKNYTFKRALAYETSINGDDAIVVVLSGQAVTGEKLKEVREAEKEGSDGQFERPFLKLIFTKTGELKYWGAAAGGTFLGRQSGTAATGQMKVENGRAIGKANEPLATEGMFPSGFDVHFDVPLLKADEFPPPSTAKKGGPAANVKPTVTGTFKGNGKEAKLAFVSARWGEPFSGKAGIELVFTEKDQSKSKKPEFDAGFGKLGSALVISLHDDGSIYGCQVVHSAHQKQGFSSIGSLETNDFSYADGKVEGELTTHGQVETFGETWEVDLKFVAPLGETPKELMPAEEKKPAKMEKGAAKSDDDDDDDVDADVANALGGLSASTGPKAKDLALTKDASEVEYKGLVGQIAFKSKMDVKTACADLAANLKGQGWTNDGRDMIQPTSSILRRKNGKATLTIFVKPDSGGSEVKMMTEGLAWDGQ